MVDFLHRSVLGYLDTSSHWKDILCDHSTEFEVDSAILEGLLANLKIACYPDANEVCPSDWHFLLRKMIDAMHFNRLAEVSTRRAQSDVLESIDATMAAAWGNPIAREYTGLHCSNFAATILPDKEGTYETTFLAFAIICGAELYVKEQLRVHDSRLPAKKGRPLLDYAVHPEPDWSSFVFGSTQNIVKMLLANGSNPNEQYDGYIIWSYVLQAVSKHEFSNSEGRVYGPLEVSSLEYQFKRLEIVEILLQHGADPHAASIKGVSAPDALREAVRKPCLCGYRTISECQCDTAAKLRATVLILLRLLKEKDPKLNIETDGVDGVGCSTTKQAHRASSALQTSRRKRIGQWFAQALRRDSQS